MHLRQLIQIGYFKINQPVFTVSSTDSRFGEYPYTIRLDFAE
jgi:hypothetical protein